MALNSLSYSQINEELLVHRLERLRKHLYPSEQPFSEANWRCRFAPSIIVRGEAEVFGLAMPRFAHRVYLSADGNDLSFVNARRISVLKSAGQLRTWGNRIDGRHRKVMALPDVRIRAEMVEDPEKNPASQIADASPVADSYLRLPARFRERGYRALEVDLSVAYGERDPDQGRSFPATPYMRHIKLAGGGMCAQACCFMANCVLVEHSRHVAGLAEITALADEGFAAFSERDTQDAGHDAFELKISGLTVEGVARYFESVGLKAALQRGAPPASQHPHRVAGASREWGCALRAYLRSNMPILLPVDLERMAGGTSEKLDDPEAGPTACLPIYTRVDSVGRRSRDLEPFDAARRSGQPASRAPVRHPSRHLVMLSGYDTRSPLNFLINDPAVLPFVEVTVGQLENCASYADSDLSRLKKREFISVCPEGCRLPLCQWKDPSQTGVGAPAGRQEWEPGLISIIDALQGGLMAGDLPRVPRDSRFDDLRLMTLHDCLRSVSRSGESPETDRTDHERMLPAALRAPLEEIARQNGWQPERYLWVQTVHGRDRSVWVFDAEQKLPSQAARAARKSRGEPERTDDEQRGFLRLVIARTSADEWTEHRLPAAGTSSMVPTLPAAEAPPSAAGEIVPGARRALQASLITSTSILGTEEALNNWPGVTGNCLISAAELYTFMNADEWLSEFSVFDGASLKPLYHRLFEMEEGVISRLADKVAHEFASRRCKLVALASFIPEITDGNLTQSKIACGAIANLVRLGHAINAVQCQPRHEIGVLELVAGSLVDGFWPGTMEGDHNPVYVANVSSRSAAIRKLVHTLADLDLGALNEGKSRGIRLAFEYEPGAMCVLGDTRSLRAFASRVHEARLDGVGFNIDIPHWDFLGGITVDEMRSESWRFVRPLLFHAHVSDHTRGHFGDCPPGWLHPEACFARWFEFLSELPSFSGYVSLEMEAVKSRSVLTSAAAVILRLANQSALPPPP